MRIKVFKGDSFISQAEQKHFNGKEYLEHTSLLSFSKHEVSIKELLKYFYSSRKTDDKRTFNP